MFVKGAKFPKWGPNFLGNMASGGPNFLGNLARGGQIFGGAKFPVTPAVLTIHRIHMSLTFMIMLN